MDWSEVAHLFSFVSGVGLIVVGALADTEPVLSVIGSNFSQKSPFSFNF